MTAKKILSTVSLKTGEEMTVVVVKGQCERLIKQKILRLLGHLFGEDPRPWWQVEQALDGLTDDLEVRFYLGLVGDEPISVVMSAEHRQVGVFGNVVTAPEHRRKGACSKIMSLQMPDFRERDVQALYLGTGYEGVPYRIYYGFGFRSIEERSGVMRWIARPDFDAVWWQQSNVSVRDVAWRDWPTMRVLIAVAGQQRLRSYAYKVYGRGSSSMTLVGMIRDFKDGRAQVKVAETAPGRTVGFASLKRCDDGTAILDAFTHPQFRNSLPLLLNAFDYRDAEIKSYVEKGNDWQIGALQEYGFKEHGAVVQEHGIGAIVMTR